ncbi:hypothetical protein IP88_13270 [alpha proteobacterium AAP81b]|nr:hypothetical protein IP88_13270 [alpha proteobacterium AAP81b]
MLLDTHAALWWWRDPPRLSAAATAAIAESADVAVSIVSALEIAIKWRTGKLAMLDDPVVNYPKLMAANGFASLAIAETHALAVALLPTDHRDPFDRLIAAQALAEGLIVVTRDPVFRNFGCKVLW